MIVTTSYEPSGEQLAKAQAAAKELGAAFAPRGRSSLERLLAEYGEQELLLVAKDGLQLVRPGEPPLFFHPSMAAIRLKRLRAGEDDAMLSAARIEPGDAVLDCTAGLASDSIVFSYGVGEKGSVTALESEPIVAWLVADGLATYDTGDERMNEALRRIRLKRKEHLDYLSGLPDRSVDVVYFDPMFRRPIGASTSISPLREQANHRELAREAVLEARRVARKAVVMKEQRLSGEFARLGFDHVIPTARKLGYGVMIL
ncbi:class I SAM-dependent methyltransferase [Paenibacillus chartarius]|uniref:Class I SAM-dependent methyltransferase n=1 Tax=Paenibacillus chartarius TaxID=747481 RepID=A0ABV6DPY8_9BACL